MKEEWLTESSMDGMQQQGSSPAEGHAVNGRSSAGFLGFLGFLGFVY